VDRKAIVLQKYNAKVEAYSISRREKCNDEFYESINLEVDSMMFFLVQKMKGESDKMPERPIRPKTLVDTIVLDNKPEKK
jgi:hypothetical protein